MKNKSVYELINNESDLACRSELYVRFHDYSSKSKRISDVRPVDEIENELHEEFINALNGDDERFMAIIDEYESAYDEVKLAGELEKIYNEQVSDGFVIRLLLKILTTSKTFTAVYFALFITNLLDKKYINGKLEEILLVYCNSVYFSFHIVNLFKDRPDFLQLQHKAYYSTIGEGETGSINFYFDYPYKGEKSLFAILRKLAAEKKNAHGYLMLPFTLQDKYETGDEFEALLEKHNNPLYTYLQIKSCVEDFDEYFSKEGNIKKAIDHFMNILARDFKKYPYVVILVMTLLTRCTKGGTMAFAIGCTRMFTYYRNNDTLYKFIEDMCSFGELVTYALYALQTHPHFQTIAYRVATSYQGYIKTSALEYLDPKIKKNYVLFQKEMKDPLIRPFIALEVLKKIDMMSFMDQEDLFKKDIEFIANIFVGMLSSQDFDAVNSVSNFDEMIEKFYKNFVSTGKFAPHVLSTMIQIYIDYLDEDPKSEKYKNIVLSNMVYEDEVDYIDESLDSRNVCIQDIAIMMDYYQYVPVERVLKFIESDPMKYLRLILCISAVNDQEALNKALDLLDKKISLPDSHLKIDNTEELIDDNDTMLQEYFRMLTIAEILSQSETYYPNLYRAGISYFAAPIRLMFYNSLKELSDNSDFYDDELFEIIEANYPHETDEEILKIMDALLNVPSDNLN